MVEGRGVRGVHGRLRNVFTHFEAGVGAVGGKAGLLRAFANLAEDRVTRGIALGWTGFLWERRGVESRSRGGSGRMEELAKERLRGFVNFSRSHVIIRAGRPVVGAPAYCII